MFSIHYCTATVLVAVSCVSWSYVIIDLFMNKINLCLNKVHLYVF